MNTDSTAGAGRAAGRPAAFVYRHVVSFEETNVVGNVYYARHISWQGRCREMFLKEKAPSVLDEIYRELRLVTLSVACDYYNEFHAFDEIELHMRLASLRQHRIALTFDYIRAGDPEATLCARGRQEIGCMRARNGALEAVAPPEALRRALADY